MKKIIICIICVLILAIIVMYAIDMSRIKNNKLVGGYAPTKDEDESKVISCFTRTYQVLNIAESNDQNYLYLTIRQFQVDEVVTVKVKRNLANTTEVNKYYEFSFENADNEIEDNIDSIFENATLKDITETDKIGLEQVQDKLYYND